MLVRWTLAAGSHSHRFPYSTQRAAVLSEGAAGQCSIAAPAVLKESAAGQRSSEAPAVLKEGAVRVVPPVQQKSCCCTERSMLYLLLLQGSCCATVGPMEPEAEAPEAALGQQLCGRCARGACNTRGPRLGCLDSALAPQLHLSWNGTAGREGFPVRSQQ